MKCKKNTVFILTAVLCLFCYPLNPGGVSAQDVEGIFAESSLTGIEDDRRDRETLTQDDGLEAQEQEFPDGSHGGGKGEEDFFGQGQGEPEAKEEKEEILHQPRAMIVQDSLQGDFLQAGSSESWRVTAKNCSGSQTMENIKVTLISDHKDVIFEKRSWYFERILPGGRMDLSQEISVGKKAAAELAPIQFQFEYEDEKGTAYSASEALSFVVRQTPSAEFTNCSMPESIYEADTESVAFQVRNTGLAVIYNAKVRLEATGLFADEVFLGNLEAGASADGELLVFAGTLNMDAQGEIKDEGAKKYGDSFGRILFSYENEEGEVITKEQDFSTAIKKPQMAELRIEEEEPATNQWWVTVAAMVMLVSVLLMIWLYLRMKYYQRMGQRVYEKT